MNLRQTVLTLFRTVTRQQLKDYTWSDYYSGVLDLQTATVHDKLHVRFVRNLGWRDRRQTPTHYLSPQQLWDRLLFLKLLQKQSHHQYGAKI
jgi:hypothetical protein